MKIKINKKTIIISVILILLILVSLIIINNGKIKNIVKTIFKEDPIKEISYEIYSNKNNILKLMITVTDTENGISEIQLPDGGTLTCYNRNQMAIEYKIEEDGEYTFKYISSTGEEKTKKLVVNDEFRNSLIGIEKIQEVSTEQDYKITKKYDGQSEFIYYYAVGENNTEWTEIQSHEIVNVDMYKINENNWQNEDGTTTLKVKKVDKYGNTVEVKKVINDIEKTGNIYNEEEQEIEGDSIIECVRDNELESGNYTLKVNGEEYPAEIYNYEENMNYLTDKNLGTSEEDSRMLIMKYNGNLNIAENNLITVQTRKKGMFIYVAGELTNNGEISMTARGAKAEGQDVYLWKHENGAYEYVPAEGAEGGEAVSASMGSTNGKQGYSGNNRRTGGGGSGYAIAYGKYYDGRGYSTVGASSGNGAIGSSWSGGPGGGGGYRYGQSGDIGGTNGSAGLGGGSTGGSGAYGGTGNPGGTPDGTSGTGGLLIVYANQLDNRGNITSKGTDSNGYGGASGGGSVNIFYNKLISEGTIDATGGNGVNGGNGGDGSVTLQDINIKSPTITVDEIIEEASLRINIEDTNTELEGITYNYYINEEKVKENTNSQLETITNLKPGQNYKVRVELIYNDYRIFSNEVVIRTSIYPNWTEQILDYPILTINGMVNVKYTNPEDETDYVYTLDLNKDCTATDALDKAAYDGNETTCSKVSEGKSYFFVEKDVKMWYIVCKSKEPPYFSCPSRILGGK